MQNPTCEYCGKDLGEFEIKTFALAYKDYNKNGKRSLFCNEDCFKSYINQYQVKEYKGRPIYMVDVDGEKRYMPYWFSPYYFITLEDCKRRMDNDIVGIYPKNVLRTVASSEIL